MCHKLFLVFVLLGMISPTYAGMSHGEHVSREELVRLLESMMVHESDDDDDAELYEDDSPMESLVEL